MTDAPDLPEVPDLTALIDRLTAEHTVEVPDSDGITVAVRRPPLLRDLAAARTASIGVGRGSAQQPHARTMLNVDAADLLTAIETRVRSWAIRAGLTPTGTAWPPVDRVLAAWHDTAGPDRITPARIRRLADWVQAIEDLLDPPRRYTLDDPCPLCGTGYVDTADTHGRALHVTARIPAHRSVVTCRACAHIWPGLDGAHQLMRQIRGEQAAS